MASSGSALALAARLRALDDDALHRLILDRGVRRQGVRDYFDLAEILLDRRSIQAALEKLDRGTIALLAVAGDLAATAAAPTVGELSAALGVSETETEARAQRAADAGLLGRESGRLVPWDAVVEQLAAWPGFGLPGTRELLETPPPAALEPVSESDARFVDRGATERAFATVAGVTEIVLEARAEPLRRLSRGGLALPDARRLGTLLGVETDRVELLVEVATTAGLLEAAPRSWRHDPRAEVWVSCSRIERWHALAAAWLDRLPSELRELLRLRARAVWGGGLLDYLDWRYPAGGEWMRRQVAQAVGAAEELGLLGASTPSSVGTALLAEGPDAAAAILAESFPDEVDRVYVQNDLSIVAPGPLRADLDLRLRRVSESDAQGLASRYRITAESVDGALRAGESATAILGLLGEISLTGIPQPLDYLVRDAESRIGTIRVGAATAEGARSYVSAQDPTLLRELLVDPRLAPLGLRESDETRLVSRFERDLVYGALADAKYPVAVEDADGRIVAAGRRTAVNGDDPAGEDTAAILIARIRDSAGPSAADTTEDWITRQLELAVKNRVEVVVRVHMPGGDEHEFLLEPAAVAGGRLRARDRRADLERTLPLSSITAVEPAPD